MGLIACRFTPHRWFAVSVAVCGTASATIMMMCLHVLPPTRITSSFMFQ